MLNQYETVFIFTPVLSEPQVKEAVKKFRDIITENGGEMVHEEDWGMKKLAYPIQKKSTGFYHLFEFRFCFWFGHPILSSNPAKYLPYAPSKLCPEIFVQLHEFSF